MNVPARPRLLIDVQPALLGLMLANVLTRLGVDEVVHIGTATPAGVHYDAALTTAIRPADIAAPVVIKFPDQEGNAGIGEITDRKGMKTVAIVGLDTVLELLDLYCPAQVKRATGA